MSYFVAESMGGGGGGGGVISFYFIYIHHVAIFSVVQPITKSLPSQVRLSSDLQIKWFELEGTIIN